MMIKFEVVLEFLKYKHMNITFLKIQLCLLSSNTDVTTGKNEFNDKVKQRTLKNCCNVADDVELLRSLGRVRDMPDGGAIISSSPNLTSFHMPRHLKMKNIQLWDKSDLIWLNM